MESKDLSVEEVHLAILRDAENLANQRIALELDIGDDPSRTTKERSSIVSGRVFRADPVQSERGGLTLSVDDLVVETTEGSKLDYIYEVGAWAIEEAVYNNQELWLEMIFHESMNGRNYFDRFVKPGEQKVLF